MENKKKLQITTEFVMLIISLILLLLFITLELGQREFKWIRILFVFLPVLVFTGIYLLRRIIKIKSLLIVTNILLIIAYCIFLFYQFLYIAFVDSIEPVTNVGCYQNILKYRNYPYTEISHFPKSIPADASNVFVYDQQPFLQGGSMLYLRYTASEEEIKDLYEEYKKSVKFILTTDKYNMDSETKEYYYPSGYDLESFVGDLYKDVYDVYIIDCASGDHDEIGFLWNHGYSYGLMINQTYNDLIYWSDVW